jgi:hypothetical protein
MVRIRHSILTFYVGLTMHSLQVLVSEKIRRSILSCSRSRWFLFNRAGADYDLYGRGAYYLGLVTVLGVHIAIARTRSRSRIFVFRTHIVLTRLLRLRWIRI